MAAPRRQRRLVPPTLAFVQEWQPFMQANIDVPNGRAHPFALFAGNPSRKIQDAFVDMLNTTYIDVHSDVPDNDAKVYLSLPELAVISLHVFDVRYTNHGPPFQIRVTHPPEAEGPWTPLLGGDVSLLQSLQKKADAVLLEIWTRRQQTVQQLTDTLPDDVLQFTLAPYISYKRQSRRHHALPRRRVSMTSRKW